MPKDITEETAPTEEGQEAAPDSVDTRSADEGGPVLPPEPSHGDAPTARRDGNGALIINDN